MELSSGEQCSRTYRQRLLVSLYPGQLRHDSSLVSSLKGKVRLSKER